MSEHGHDRVEELLALRALGNLAEDERAELDNLRAATGACAECARLERDYLEAAAQLAYALPPAPIPEGAERRLLESTVGDAQASATGDQDAPSRRGRHTVTGGAAADRRPRWRGRLVAAAAAVVLVVAGGAAGFGLDEVLDQRSGTERATAQEKLTAFLTDPDTRLAGFPSPGRSRVTVAYRPGSSTAWIVASDLDRPGGKRVYQLWYSTRAADGVRPSDTFVPGADGSLAVRTRIGGDSDQLAVSVEPRGGSRQPTSDPIMAVDL